MCKRIIAVVLCAALVVSILPVLSFTSFADNSGFCQIRIFYKVSDELGNFGPEQSAIITDNSFMMIATHNMLRPMQITRFLIRNDSNATAYFQFDINFGGAIPVSGAYPSATYSSIAFTTNGGVTAYSFPTTDKSPFEYQEVPSTNYCVVLNSAASRTFFGKVNSTGYVNFNNPVTITFRKNDSYDSSLYIFFRHLVIGYDNSSYLTNMEQYLSNIDSNVGHITDWMEEEHTASHDFLDAGGQDLLDDAASFAPSGFGVIGALFGASSIISIHPGTYSFQNRFWTQWAHNQMQGNSTRSTNDDDDYIDFFEQNKNQYWAGD